MSVPTLAGDWSDDDGPVTESMTEENTDGAGAKGFPPATVPTVPPKEKPRPTTRIVGTDLKLQSAGGNLEGWQPQMVLPADADRKSLHIHVNAIGTDGSSAGLGSDVVRFSDEKSLVTGKECAAITTTQPVDGVPHTGPVWLYAPPTNNSGAGGYMQVQVWAVTL